MNRFSNLKPSSRTVQVACCHFSAKPAITTQPLIDNVNQICKRKMLSSLIAITAGQMIVAPRPSQAISLDIPQPHISPSLAPDQSKYDPNDKRLRDAYNLLQSGLNATSVEREEAIWTEIITKYGEGTEPWIPDIVGRAYGNRGNAKSRQGRMEEAIGDYNKSISICPWSVDPVLNRGVVLENLGLFEEAIRDYKAVLDVNPSDPSAWNNWGNATAGLGRYEEAIGYYEKAASLSPGFSFSVANISLAKYQLGGIKRNEAIKSFRSLLRRYPDFIEVRAAFAASLWADGLEAEAEDNWLRVDDPRYKDRVWLRNTRRWPPSLVDALEALMDVRSIKSV